MGTVAVRRVLCPTDFSPASDHALSVALEIARTNGAALTVMHVCASPAWLPHKAPAASTPVDVLARLQEVISAHGGQEPGIRITPLVQSGDPASAILEAAASLNADLVVAGTHGRHGLERFVLGSVAEKVLRRASCAVMTVPPRTGSGDGRFTHILCATDFSPASRVAFAAALAMAASARVPLTLVHVIEWPWPEPPGPVLAELPNEQAAALAAFRSRVTAEASDHLTSMLCASAAGQQVTARVMHGKAYEQILHAASDAGADLLVLGVHGRSAADLFFFGSTTNQLVRMAQCPVVTVRA